ncbi:MAG: hypothetical protein VXV73_02815, partial [Actinomycetota bacterium]|nr:hypothetical protein [Actinomycetota bacterium]
MNSVIYYLLIGVIAYLLGSIPIAYVIANHLYPDAVDIERIPLTGYAKKYSSLMKTIETGYQVAAIDEKTHA